MAFWQFYWDFVREEVLAFFKEFHDHNCFVRSLNATFIALISTKGGTEELKDFRLISLVSGINQLNWLLNCTHWLPWLGLWAVLGLFFSCARDVGLLLVLFACPGLWGFFLVVFVGYARMWVLGFVYQVCLVVCDWLCPYVGDWFLFIRCSFVSG